MRLGSILEPAIPVCIDYTLNSINPSIQFIMEYSKEQILFVDILIKTSEKTFGGTFVISPQAQKDVFRPSHPNRYQQNILFCTAQRICTILESNANK